MIKLKLIKSNSDLNIYGMWVTFPVLAFVNVKLFIFYWSECTFIWTCWFEFEISIPLKNKIFFYMKKKYGDILGLLSVNFRKSTGSSNKDENRE